MKGQESICKAGRDIKRNPVLENKFQVPVEEERMSKLRSVCKFLCAHMYI